MVENMYWGGLLQIELFGIQRVSYNQKFAKSLKDLPRNNVKDANPTSNQKFVKSLKDLPRNDVKDANPTNKKRKRVETSANHERKKKKISKSGRKEG